MNAARHLLARILAFSSSLVAQSHHIDKLLYVEYRSLSICQGVGRKRRTQIAADCLGKDFITESR
jgi:hypothetical protein